MKTNKLFYIKYLIFTFLLIILCSFFVSGFLDKKKEEEKLPDNVVEYEMYKNIDLFKAKAKKEVIDKINEIGNYNNSPDFIHETKKQYDIYDQKNVKATIEFTKLSNTIDETNEILRVYNETNDDRFFKDALINAGLDYFIYKVDVKYSKEIEDDFPAFLIVDENGKEFDGWSMQPFILYFEQISNSNFVYTMAFTKPTGAESKICAFFSPNYGEKSEFLCLQ